ncbi:hypothetical protein [Streptomyces lanatus]|uniref:Uncharacterized protein n=1 Tax=Streptomyces lanatus TaxID=66900 RepID=A0ABV1XLA5_9ACTN|nr:hypothetical protein [Streptomyces lanatus]
MNGMVTGEAAGEAGQAVQVRRGGVLDPGGQQDACLLGEHVAEVACELMCPGQL